MDLIKITKNKTGKGVVNARELHKEIESKQEFSAWFKKKVITSVFFRENEDWTLTGAYDYKGNLLILRHDKFINTENQQVTPHKIEYAITIDTAKKVAMAEQTEKGEIVRNYFIEKERQVNEQLPKSLPENYIQALEKLIETEKEKELLKLEISENKPKIELHDKLMSSDVAISFGQFAKMINIGRNQLFQLCRKDKILITGGRENNNPYQTFLNRGYFEVIETPINVYIDTVIVKQQTLITPKGQKWLSNKYQHNDK